jgi:hypothetical protein
MTTDEKLAIARVMVEKVAPLVRERGKHEPAGPTHPSTWELELAGLLVLYAENALLYPDDDDASNHIDIWPIGERKAFSASWKPDKPWLPPRVALCKGGDWLKMLCTPSP